MILAEDYLTEIRSCSTQLEAERIANQIFSTNVSESCSFFNASVNIGGNWSVFYELLEMENKFNLGHHASAYAAVVLSKPKLSALWMKKQNVKKCTDFEDFRMNIFYALIDKIIPPWDRTINDNFLAFAISEYRTVANKTAEPEVTQYITNEYGVTLESLEAISENLGHEFDVPDTYSSTEDQALVNIEKEEKKELHILLSCNKDADDLTESESKEQIKKALIVTQLFGGLSNELIERVNSIIAGEPVLAIERG